MRINQAPLALALALAAIAPGAAQALPIGAWYGKFVYEEPLGRIGGAAPQDGVSAFVTYTLTLGPPTSGTGCRVSIHGYQTNMELMCTATPEMEKLIIKYYSNRPGMMGRGFVSGQPLFSLARGENGLLTRWQALTPASDATPRIGRMFQRVY